MLQKREESTMSYVSNAIIASMISCRYMRAETQRKRKDSVVSDFM